MDFLKHKHKCEPQKTKPCDMHQSGKQKTIVKPTKLDDSSYIPTKAIPYYRTKMLETPHNLGNKKWQNPTSPCHASHLCRARDLRVTRVTRVTRLAG